MSPEKLESIKDSIRNKLKGKINPRTKKPYTEDDFWAIAQATYKKLKEK